MIEVGLFNNLKIARFASPGAFLKDEDGNEILLPNKYIPPKAKSGDELAVFVYTDSEDRLIATTLKPNACRDEFACLKVKDANTIGAFLDWGLEKDLLVPHRQQDKKMRAGEWHLVYVYLDKLTDRLVATAKIKPHFERENIQLEVDEEVDLLIAGRVELGVEVVINNQYKGLVFESDIFQDVLPGDRVKGYVKTIRPDKKIDVSLRKKGLENLEKGAQDILQELQANEGFLPLHDKSDPVDIQSMLQMSKKNFKRSVGILYKQKLVKLEKDGLRLN
ncbi:MAG: GntR family transcriptional regulator [Cyclobacteriaceae bacterium]|nr:GntR family transcriptional regulator [Cyclobacteriaceae bacterium HetDA_MAG_MS6]